MLLEIDFNSEVPIYMQIRNCIVIGISQKKLLPGDHLPTVRALSEESGVNAMTISKAYQVLKKDGYISTDRRGGAVVRDENLSDELSKALVEKLTLCIAELKASGYGEDTILDLCKKIYLESNKQK